MGHMLWPVLKPTGLLAWLLCSCRPCETWLHPQDVHSRRLFPYGH